MKKLAVLTIVAALCAAPGLPAFAFQAESEGATATNPLPGIEVRPEATPNGAGVQLTVPEAVGGPSQPTVVVPGLGELPKLDFGLELLYGTIDKSGGSAQRQNGDDAEDLTVRGAVKQTF